MTRPLASLAALVAISLAAPALYAHDTGHESRTAAQCNKLPGTKKTGERGGCLACVSRPQKHHYHPDYPAGERCRPDNGKP
jgi:hypothetical protein